ncbi:MAG: TIGR01777 family oxidoreductase [Proteobacteria bacterium]|nr:TIGR01777 family oxidoreductase [Pseudomonadota bacterium]
MGKKVFITGGTGLIGQGLQQAFVAQGWRGSVLTRSLSHSGKKILPQLQAVEGDITEKNWFKQLAGHDVLIHLAGFPLFDKRWSVATKAMIRDSRVTGTKNLVTAIKALAKDQRPKRIISASAVGYYGILVGDQPLDESALPGDDFLAQVAVDWEKEAEEFQSYVDHVTIFRIGVVLSLAGGMLARVIPIFRSALGGKLGTGKQWISWIHADDVIQFMSQAALSHQWPAGLYNLTAPNPVTNAEFTKVLGHLIKRPTVLAIPKVILQNILGEGSRYVLTGQRVIPAKLIQSGATFYFPKIDVALQDLLRKS